jgi:phosphoglycolate phosphatase-like HAD superfamily hydrolase
MINFSKYKVILWDFDGVLMDSMPVRDRGFELTLANYPKKQVQELMEYHRQNGGLSRYAKFRFFFEKIRGEQVSEEQILTLAKCFSEVMMQHLINPELLIKDSFDFVKRYHQKFAMHIVSGSDGNELNEICKRLNLSHFFLSIHGSPISKIDLVASLLQQNNYPKEATVLIGDSKNDGEAALVNGIEFIGYNNIALASSFIYLDSFSNVT